MSPHNGELLVTPACSFSPARLFLPLMGPLLLCITSPSVAFALHKA